jgi:hypothetical protein
MIITMMKFIFVTLVLLYMAQLALVHIDLLYDKFNTKKEYHRAIIPFIKVYDAYNKLPNEEKIKEKL